jgi:hypothetical protein
MPFKEVPFDFRKIRRLPLLPRLLSKPPFPLCRRTRVTISSAALAKSAAGDKDHDSDSK